MTELPNTQTQIDIMLEIKRKRDGINPINIDLSTERRKIAFGALAKRGVFFYHETPSLELMGLALGSDTVLHDLLLQRKEERREYWKDFKSTVAILISFLALLVSFAALMRNPTARTNGNNRSAPVHHQFFPVPDYQPRDTQSGNQNQNDQGVHDSLNEVF